MTFIDKVYHVGYNHNITIFINKPKKGIYKPSYTDINKESNHKKVTKEDLKVIKEAFPP